MGHTDFWCGSLKEYSMDLDEKTQTYMGGVYEYSLAGIIDLVNLTYDKSAMDVLKFRVLQGKFDIGFDWIKWDWRALAEVHGLPSAILLYLFISLYVHCVWVSV